MGRAFEYRRAAKEKRWGKMSKIFPKLATAITIAAKEGGVDPEMNAKLRTAIANAKAQNMPKDNIEAAIKRASGKDGNFEEVTYDYATIAQWLTDIDNADLVVTTSFHGIVFSIIMETPFVYVPLAGKNAQGNNRISGLLQDLNLGSRILRKGISYKEIASRPIDWLEAKKRLETIRMKSKEYLNQALS